MSKMKLITKICSWCGKEYGTKEWEDTDVPLDISHGICDECFVKEKEKTLKKLAAFSDPSIQK